MTRGGIDKVTIEEFNEKETDYLGKLHEEIKGRSYKVIPVRRVYIDKPGKKEKRPLGIPTIRDRVVQQALKNRLEPIMEEHFNDCSFGYRPNRSQHDAMRKIWKDINQGGQWIVDADLRDYFGTVNHELLIDLVARKVSDGRVLGLIKDMLEAGYMEKGRLFPTKRGTPQGSLCRARHNVYLYIRWRYFAPACESVSGTEHGENENRKSVGWKRGICVPWHGNKESQDA